MVVGLVPLKRTLFFGSRERNKQLMTEPNLSDLKTVVLGKTQSAVIQFIRYAFVGGTAAVLDTACLYLLYRYLGVNHFLAAALGFLLGLATNYLLSILWVLKQWKYSSRISPLLLNRNRRTGLDGADPLVCCESIARASSHRENDFAVFSIDLEFLDAEKIRF